MKNKMPKRERNTTPPLSQLSAAAGFVLLQATLLLMAFTVLRSGGLGETRSFGLGSLGSAAPRDEARAARRSYLNLPLWFEPNQGQTDERVKFLSRGKGYNLFLTADEFVFVASRQTSDAAPSAGEAVGREASPSDRDVIRMKLSNANPRPAMRGVGLLESQSNYFLGSDPDQWRTNIPHYEQIQYSEVYKGVDLKVHGAQMELEYDFVVASGADPAQIAVEFEGVDRLEIGPEGELLLHAPRGLLRQKKPVAFQEREGALYEVAADFRILGERRVGFRLGDYDPSEELVIDPILAYSSFLGGGADEEGLDVAVDSGGSAYITGWTESTDFPTAGAPFQGSLAGSRDVFVAKVNSTGTSLAYATYLGGFATGIASINQGHAVVVDSSGNAYVAGQAGPNFPTTPGAYLPLGFGAFAAKLNSTGSQLIYSTYLDSLPFDIVLNPSNNNLYLVGEDFNCDGPEGIWVGHLDSDGSELLHAATVGPCAVELSNSGRGIARDPSTGNIFITGWVESDSAAGFNPTSGAVQTSFGGGSFDAFVARLNASLIPSAFTFLGGAGDDLGSGIAFSGGSVYVVGQTSSSVFPVTAGAFDEVCGADSSPSCGQGSDAFLSKLSSGLTSLTYSTYFGGSLNDAAYDVEADSAGNAYFAGATASSDLPAREGPDSSLGGLLDAFVAKIDTQASGDASLVYSTFLGGSSSDSAFGLAFDGGNAVYVTGGTLSPNFPVTSGVFQSLYRGGPGDGGFPEAFIAKIEEEVLEPCLITSVLPEVVDFGSVTVGSGSAGKLVRLLTSGGVSAGDIDWELSGDHAEEFVFVSDPPFRLFTLREIRATMQFQPAAVGERSAALTVWVESQADREDCRRSVPLEGVGLPAAMISSTPTAIMFEASEVICGMPTVQKSLVLRNDGDTAVSGLSLDWTDKAKLLVQPGGDFDLANFSIDSGDSRTVLVQYIAPDAAGLSDTLVLRSSAGVLSQIPVSAPPCQEASISASPTAIAFAADEVLCGSPTAAKSLLLRNDSGATVSGLSLDWTNKTKLLVEPDGAFDLANFSLGPGAARGFLVQYTAPDELGLNETLVLTSGSAILLQIGVSAPACQSPVDEITITKLEANVNPAQMNPYPTVGVELTSPAPVGLTGELQLQFLPDEGLPPDPVVQFLATNQETVPFTIAEGETVARFSVEGNPDAAQYQSGTVAGMIEFQIVNLQTTSGAGLPITDTGQTRVERLAPRIIEVRCSGGGNAITIATTGLSTIREVTGVSFNLIAASNSDVTFTPPSSNFANEAFQNWWSDLAQSADQGGTFLLQLQLQVQGDRTAIQAATITIQNSVGTSSQGRVEISSCQ